MAIFIQLTQTSRCYVFLGRFRVIYHQILCWGSCDGLVTPRMDKYSSSARNLPQDLSGPHMGSPELVSEVPRLTHYFGDFPFRHIRNRSRPEHRVRGPVIVVRALAARHGTSDGCSVLRARSARAGAVRVGMSFRVRCLGKLRSFVVGGHYFGSPLTGTTIHSQHHTKIAEVHK